MIALKNIEAQYRPEVILCVLMCRVYLGTATVDELQTFIQTHDIDWQFFNKVIRTHKIRPIINKVTPLVSALISADFAMRMRNQSLKIAANAMLRTQEIIRLHAKFKDADIENVAYKGVVLSYLFFNDNITRESSDIDFLIGSKDFNKAKEILEQEGYKPDYYNAEFEKTILNTSHELVFRKQVDDNKINFELHWAVTNRMMDIPISNSDVMKDKIAVDVAGHKVETFSLQNHLLVLLIHHGVNDVWRTLRHSMDIALFVHKHNTAIDWNELHTAAKSYKIKYTSEVGLALAHALFGIDIPEAFRNEQVKTEDILHNALKFPPIEKRKLGLSNIRQQLELRDSWMDKARIAGAYIATGIKPNIRDVAALPLPKSLYPLYYFIKPFRILFKNR